MRDAAVQQFVRALTGSWFQPPRGMDAAGQADQVAEIARAVNEALPLSLLPEQIDEALEVARSALLRGARSRAWPIIREVVDAVRSGLPKQAGRAVEDEADKKRAAIRLEAAHKWFAKFGDLPGWASDQATVRALIADGVKPHDLWRGGVDVPRDLRDWPAAAEQRNAPAHRRFGDFDPLAAE